jgi:hypothetical protein
MFETRSITALPELYIPLDSTCLASGHVFSLFCIEFYVCRLLRNPTKTYTSELSSDGQSFTMVLYYITENWNNSGLGHPPGPVVFLFLLFILANLGHDKPAFVM